MPQYNIWLCQSMATNNKWRQIFTSDLPMCLDALLKSSMPCQWIICLAKIQLQILHVSHCLFKYHLNLQHSSDFHIIVRRIFHVHIPRCPDFLCICTTCMISKLYGFRIRVWRFVNSKLNICMFCFIMFGVMSMRFVYVVAVYQCLFCMCVYLFLRVYRFVRLASL